VGTEAMRSNEPRELRSCARGEKTCEVGECERSGGGLRAQGGPLRAQKLREVRSCER